MIEAGRLRHRIDIQEALESQDLVTGAVEVTWVTIHANVPAAVEPLSVREFLASQQAQSEVSVRIVIRYLPDLKASMRILHEGKIYNPAGFLADKDSGLEYLTIPCSSGVNQGQ